MPDRKTVRIAKDVRVPWAVYQRARRMDCSMKSLALLKLQNETSRRLVAIGDFIIIIPMKVDFRWIEWNSEHATKHGCAIPEIESVVRNAGRGFPRKIGDEKWMVIGRGVAGRMMQVIFLRDDDGTLFVVHASPLTTRRRR